MRNIAISFATVLLATITIKTSAQSARIPEASPTQTIIQDFGLGKITITYSRPSVKGRVIFGGINPWGQVWRTGANSATTITFSENVFMEGHAVPAGTYSLFTIPDHNEWTIILNKVAKQWGAYSYKQSEDFLRFTEVPTQLQEKRESFTIQFANVTAQSNDLDLVWDHTRVVIHMHTDDDAQIMANIDELMKTAPKANYFNAIQYYYENNKDMNKALAWALDAEKTDPGAWYQLWEARIRLRMGDKPAAIAAAQKGIKMAQDNKDDEYVRLNQAVIDQANGS